MEGSSSLRLAAEEARAHSHQGPCPLILIHGSGGHTPPAWCWGLLQEVPLPAAGPCGAEETTGLRKALLGQALERSAEPGWGARGLLKSIGLPGGCQWQLGMPSATPAAWSQCPLVAMTQAWMPEELIEKPGPGAASRRGRSQHPAWATASAPSWPTEGLEGLAGAVRQQAASLRAGRPALAVS